MTPAAQTAGPTRVSRGEFEIPKNHSTEKEYEKEYRQFQKDNMLRDPRPARGPKKDDVSAMYVNGDKYINGPYYSYGSSSFTDDYETGIANAIWNISVTRPPG